MREEICLRRKQVIKLLPDVSMHTQDCDAPEYSESISIPSIIFPLYLYVTLTALRSALIQLMNPKTRRGAKCLRHASLEWEERLAM
jgi:hypothetical protein